MLSALLGRGNTNLALIFRNPKSSRQTTPNLIKNPKLTSRGWLRERPKKQRNYDIPQNTPNRHLYWNHLQKNKQASSNYQTRKLYDLNIRPLAVGKDELFQRPLAEIMMQLADIRVIKKSKGRTFANLSQVFEKYPLVQNDHGILVFAAKQIHDRHLTILNPRQFWQLCVFYNRLKIKHTLDMFTHFYKFIEADTWEHKMRFNPFIFAQLVSYFFSPTFSYPDSYKPLFYRQPVEFKLFQDLPPASKPLVELVPLMYSEENIRFFKIDPRFAFQRLKPIEKIPGGKQLLKKIQSVN